MCVWSSSMKSILQPRWDSTVWVAPIVFFGIGFSTLWVVISRPNREDENKGADKWMSCLEMQWWAEVTGNLTNTWLPFEHVWLKVCEQIACFVCNAPWPTDLGVVLTCFRKLSFESPNVWQQCNNEIWCFWGYIFPRMRIGIMYIWIVQGCCRTDEIFSFGISSCAEANAFHAFAYLWVVYCDYSKICWIWSKTFGPAQNRKSGFWKRCKLQICEVIDIGLSNGIWRFLLALWWWIWWIF